MVGWRYFGKEDVRLTMTNFSKYDINACVKEEGDERNEWQLMRIYGNPDSSHRLETWNLISLF